MELRPEPTPATLRVDLGPYETQIPGLGRIRVKPTSQRYVLGNADIFYRATNPEGWRAFDTYAARFLLRSGPSEPAIPVLGTEGLETFVARWRQQMDALQNSAAPSGTAFRVGEVQVVMSDEGASSEWGARSPALLEVFLLDSQAQRLPDFFSRVTKCLENICADAHEDKLVVQVQVNGVVKGTLEVTPT